MITASQVALALDVLAHMPVFPPRDVPLAGSVSSLVLEDPREGLVRKAAAVIEAAFSPDWTGRVDGQCNEYGKAPVSEDPEAQQAVLRLKALSNRLAYEKDHLTPDQYVVHSLIDDLRGILEA